MYERKLKDELKVISEFLSENNSSLSRKDQLIESKPIVIASIDTYHPISGLSYKLQSYLRFLRKYP